MTKERVMTFEVQELPTFSINRFNLQNVLNFNNTRLQGRAEGTNEATTSGILMQEAYKE